MASDGGGASDDAGGGQHADAQSAEGASDVQIGGGDSDVRMIQTCVPLSCFQSCGVVPNGCGGMMQCGACPSGETCNSIGRCIASEGGVEAGAADAAIDTGAANGCAPNCTTGDVCLSTQVQGGCPGCNQGPPSFACAPLPSACGATVDCTCAKSLCPAAYTCMSASASGVVCIKAVP